MNWTEQRGIGKQENKKNIVHRFITGKSGKS